MMLSALEVSRAVLTRQPVVLCSRAIMAAVDMIRYWLPVTGTSDYLTVHSGFCFLCTKQTKIMNHTYHMPWA